MLVFDCGRIKTLRETHRMTMDDMALKIGKHKQQIGLWEAGANNPTLEHLLLICNNFDVPIDFFVYEASNTIDDMTTER